MCTITLRNQVLLNGEESQVTSAFYRFYSFSTKCTELEGKPLWWLFLRCIPAETRSILGDCTTKVSAIIGWWNVSGRLFTAVMMYHLGWSGQGLISQNCSLLQLLLACVKNALYIMIPWAPEGPETVLSTIPCSSVFKRPLFQVWWLIQIKYMHPDVPSYVSLQPYSQKRNMDVSLLSSPLFLLLYL